MSPRFKNATEDAVCQICFTQEHKTDECHNARPSIPLDADYDSPTTSASTPEGPPRSNPSPTSALKRKIDTSGFKEEKKRKIVLSPPQFDHERGAVKLYQASNFVGLLADIRTHLLMSESTRAIYIAMADMSLTALPQDVRETFSKPSDQDFLNYVTSEWPTFSSFTEIGSTLPVTWGFVEMGAQEPHKVNILSDIVVSAESAAAVPNVTTVLPVELYNLLITVIILHELSHAFIKFWFNGIITNVGVGAGRDPQDGEAGWLVEEQIMGGRLAVEWDEKVRDMDAINRVLLIKPLCTLEIDAKASRAILSSLRETTVDQSTQDRMKTHFHRSGSVCTRITEAAVTPESR